MHLVTQIGRHRAKQIFFNGWNENENKNLPEELILNAGGGGVGTGNLSPLSAVS